MRQKGKEEDNERMKTGECKGVEGERRRHNYRLNDRK